MQVDFNLYGKIITFDADLKKYYLLRKEFEQERDHFLSDNNWLMNDKEDVSNLYDELNSSLESFVKQLIHNLSEYNVYNKTIDDFLYTNKGYTNCLNEFSTFSKVTKELIEKKENLTNTELQNARKRAESQITGLDFGVISNSLAAHALYLKQERDAVKKQAKKAQEQYDNESTKIVRQMNSFVNDSLDEFYRDTFKPNFLKALNQCYTILFNTYLNELHKIGVINKECTKGIDYDRSNSMLDNLEIVNSKENLLVEIIQTCPYNVEAYCQAYINNIFNDELIQIARYFDISKEIILDLIGKNILYTCDNALDVHNFCINNESLFTLFSKLDNKNVKDYRKKFTDDLIKKIISHLANIKSYLNNQEKFNSDIESRFKEKNPTVKEVEPLIIDYKLIDNKGFEYLINECNQQDLYNKFTDIFDIRVSSFDEMIKAIDAQIEQSIIKYQQYIENKEEQERITLERKEEEEKKKQEKKEKLKDNIRRFLKIIIPSVILIVFAMTMINYFDGRKKEEKYVQAKNYISSNKNYKKAEDLFKNLGDYKESKKYYRNVKLILKIEDDYKNGKYLSALKNINKMDSGFTVENTIKDKCKENVYDNAVNSYNEGKIEEANDMFVELKNYRNSYDYQNNIKILSNFDKEWDNGELTFAACNIDNIPPNTEYEEKVNKIKNAQYFYGNLIGSWSFPNIKYDKFYGELVLNDNEDVVVEIIPSTLDGGVTKIQTTGEKDGNSFKAKITYDNEFSFMVDMDMLLTVTEDYDSFYEKNVYVLSIDNNDEVYESAFVSTKAYRDR